MKLLLEHYCVLLSLATMMTFAKESLESRDVPSDASIMSVVPRGTKETDEPCNCRERPRIRADVEWKQLIESCGHNNPDSNCDLIEWCYKDDNSDACPALYSRVECWDISEITNMAEAFKDNLEFNEPLNCWDVSRVMNMKHMFFNATKFNQPLHKWDIASATNIDGMFKHSKIRKGPIKTAQNCLAPTEHSVGPSTAPSEEPSAKQSEDLSLNPSEKPSISPSIVPSTRPSNRPSATLHISLPPNVTHSVCMTTSGEVMNPSINMPVDAIAVTNQKGGDLVNFTVAQYWADGAGLAVRNSANNCIVKSNTILGATEGFEAECIEGSADATIIVHLDVKFDPEECNACNVDNLVGMGGDYKFCAYRVQISCDNTNLLEIQ